MAKLTKKPKPEEPNADVVSDAIGFITRQELSDQLEARMKDMLTIGPKLMAHFLLGYCQSGAIKDLGAYIAARCNDHDRPPIVITPNHVHEFIIDWCKTSRGEGI